MEKEKNQQRHKFNKTKCFQLRRLQCFWAQKLKQGDVENEEVGESRSVPGLPNEFRYICVENEESLKVIEYVSVMA